MIDKYIKIDYNIIRRREVIPLNDNKKERLLVIIALILEILDSLKNLLKKLMD